MARLNVSVAGAQMQLLPQSQRYVVMEFVVATAAIVGKCVALQLQTQFATHISLLFIN